jgi:hypothetical protein
MNIHDRAYVAQLGMSDAHARITDEVKNFIRAVLFLSLSLSPCAVHSVVIKNFSPRAAARSLPLTPARPPHLATGARPSLRQCPPSTTGVRPRPPISTTGACPRPPMPALSHWRPSTTVAPSSPATVVTQRAGPSPPPADRH